MLSTARIFVVAMVAIAASSLAGIEAAHADWRCHIHPNAAETAGTSHGTVVSGKDQPSESSHFNFGKIEQTYKQQK